MQATFGCRCCIPQKVVVSATGCTVQCDTKCGSSVKSCKKKWRNKILQLQRKAQNILITASATPKPVNWLQTQKCVCVCEG